VLGAISVKTVRQQHHETIAQVPLGFAGSNELINHGLRTVREVTELGLPQRQRVRQARRVPVFEAKHSILRQVRATGDEVAALLGCGGLDLTDGAVVTVFILVEDVRVSVRESSALNVLT